MDNLKIGVGQVEYEPKVGLPIMGNFRDDYASKGFHDPLYSKAMVFVDLAGTKFTMLSIDICMLPGKHVAILRDFIEQDTGIQADNILIAASGILQEKPA